jgi:hypothetical protein
VNAIRHIFLWALAMASVELQAKDNQIKDTPVLIHLSRNQVHMSEEVVVKSEEGFDYIFITSNSLTPGRTEVGVYKKRGRYFYNKAHLQSGKKDSGSENRVTPHDWRIKVSGKDIEKTDPFFKDIFQTVVFELKNIKKWEPVRTIHAKLVKKNIVLTHFDSQLKTKRIETLPVSKICRFVDGKLLCRIEQGTFIL